MSDRIVLWGYGLFLLLGGYFGAKAGSKVSLIMGLVSGLLVFVGAYLTMNNPRNGFLFLSAVGGVLTVTFLIRLVKTQKMMPSGMLLVVTAIFLAYCVMQLTKKSG